MDIGESLVGSYMRQVRGCESIIYNTHLPAGQAEIDVIGIRAASPPRVWIAEVAVHLEGLEYGSGYAHSAAKVAAKVAAARAYGQRVFPGAVVTVEFWSPVVPRSLIEPLGACGADLVINEAFTSRIAELLQLATSSTRTTGDDAFRLLQILTHLRGASSLSFSRSGQAR